MIFIKDFKEINKKDIQIAGGKGANLGELIKIGIPVPDGFIILAGAFEEFLEENDINVEIKKSWNRINIKDIESVEENSEILRNLILKAKIPKKIEEEILKEFDKLKTKPTHHRSEPKAMAGGYVAVRSSATTEDSKIDSWAGELETYLNTSKENLIENIKKCWSSLYTPRAIFYRFQRKLDQTPVSVAVVVQKMVQSDVSGVCFTVHPVIKDKNQMVIEAAWGLGEILVQGKIIPDSYVIEKSNRKILEVNKNIQNKMIIGTKMGTKIISVPKPKREKQKLSEEQIKELAEICIKIEDHYQYPQDIEWVFERGKFYIVQTRPITAL